MAKKSKSVVSSSILTNLAISRGITPSAGHLFSRMPDGTLKPVVVQEASVLGTSSQYGVKADKVAKGNIQRVDTAFLDPDSDTLVVKCSVRIYRNAEGNTESCNLRDTVQAAVSDLTAAYIGAGGMAYLGSLYAGQLTNGSIIWRNRYGANLETRIQVQLDGVALPEALVFRADTDPAQVALLGKYIGQGLAGVAVVSLDIVVSVRLGYGQEVYPSQELDMSGKSSRVYYCNADHHAMIHSQKLGNAIRTIDIWHPEVKEVGAIAVEPYGANTRRQEAYRFDERGFYTYLTQIVEGTGPIFKIKDAKTLTDLDAIEDAHYFMAVLIRGGVFGMKPPKDTSDPTAPAAGDQ